MTQVFSLESLQWRDEHNRRQSCGLFQIHALPTPAAKTALARGLALEPGSERAQVNILEIPTAVAANPSATGEVRLDGIMNPVVSRSSPSRVKNSAFGQA
jgi:hypothetical protein